MSSFPALRWSHTEAPQLHYVTFCQQIPNFGKTPKGRPITERAAQSLAAILADEKNYNTEAIKCMNCGIILSSIVVTKECPNCGSIDLTTKI